MTVVIVVVPIAIVVPAVSIFIPPTMIFPPATLACFTQFMARVVRLSAVPAVVLDGFVQPVVCLGDSPLTAAVIIGVGARCCGEREQANERGRG